MLKVWNVAMGKSEEALTKLSDSAMTVSERAELQEFANEFMEKRKVCLAVHGRIKDKLEAEDPETVKEWSDYLNTDLELRPLPMHLFKKLGVASLAEEKMLRALTQQPELVAVK